MYNTFQILAAEGFSGIRWLCSNGHILLVWMTKQIYVINASEYMCEKG